MWPFTSSNGGVIASKRAQRDKDVATAGIYNPQEHAQYLSATAKEIVQNIEKGEWTASKVVEAYIARAAYAHAKTNCLTEILFAQARQEAEQLDKLFSTTGKLKGPLHGVPVSLKDQYDIEGFDSTIGFTQWAGKTAMKDSSIVQQLRAAGAIPIVKTNVPQTMLTFECGNPLWGTTTNPFSPLHTCGGSSGGEAALLALDGSAIGIGSDVGGSLRIPASYCGIYSLKPGFGRIAQEGSRGPNPGFEAIRSVAGPMGRSVDDIELISRLTFGVEDANYFPAPLPYREVELPKKLKFGYYTSDDFVKASPVCQRAVLETVEALRREGHECVEFKLPHPSRALELFAGLTSSDGYKALLSHLGPDKKEKSLMLATLGPRLYGWFRALASWAITHLIGDHIFGSLLTHSRHKTVAEFYAYTVERNEFVRWWNAEVWGKYEFDGIIAPVQAVPALPHGGCERLSPLAIATITYNLNDSPVGVVPVTRLSPSLDRITPEWFDPDSPGHGSKILERLVYGTRHSLDAKSGGKGTGIYDVEKMAGLPVGVQIVGKKWEEEKVVGMMRVVDRALGGGSSSRSEFGPGSSLRLD